MQLDRRYIKNVPGEIVTGKSYIIDDKEVISRPGAEIFNRDVNIATGYYSHAEGSYTTASGYASHAEGSSHALSSYSHAEGLNTTASHQGSHAEGFKTTASGNSSHSEGSNTTASGDFSHAEGYHTVASGRWQHVQGKHNIEDTEDKYAHIVGNGISNTKPSNAHTVDWSGNGWFAGKISQEGTPTEDKDVINKAYLETRLSGISIVKKTQAEYDALETKDPNTMYLIIG